MVYFQCVFAAITLILVDLPELGVLGSVLAALVLLVAGLLLLAAPWVLRARRALARVREEQLLSDARADMASLLYYSGQTDRAIQEVGRVLEAQPEHINGNFNLGIFYWRGRRDLQAARDQMEQVIRLTEGGDTQAHVIQEQARVILTQITAEQSGETTETTSGAAL